MTGAAGSIAPRALPVAVDAIDLPLINAMLAASGRTERIEALTLGEANHGTATKVHLSVEWDDVGRVQGLPNALVLKGGFGRHREAMAYIYLIEERFYRELQGWLGVPSPRCFATAADAEGGQALVLMEDLRAAGAKFCRVVDPIGPELARQFLTILADMHARTWGGRADGRPLEDIGTWQALPMDAGGAYARGQLEAETWQHFMHLPRALAVSRRFHDRDAMCAALLRIDAYTRDKPQCLLHADFHLGNLYLRPDGSPAVLDWQQFSLGHWSHDVTYFLVSALDQDDRRRHAEELLDAYVSALRERGVRDVPTAHEAREAFRIQLADGLFYWMVNPPEWQSEENNCAVAPRFADAALDHGTFDAVRTAV